MYCVIGEKILRCEVKKREELSSICRVGSAKSDQVIFNSRLFKTEQEAQEFVGNRKKNKVDERVLVANAVEACTALYEKLYEETGIEVRTIDRQWTISSAEKHVAKLKKTLANKPEMHAKNISKSFNTAPPKRDKKNEKFRKNFNSKSK